MSYLAGEILTADALNAWLPITVQKAATTARNTIVTEVADPDLVVPLPASTSWDFRFVLFINSIANAAGDWSGHLEWMTGGTCTYSGYSVANSLASATSADMNAGPTIRLDGTSPGLDLVFGASTTGTIAIIEGKISVSTTAGNLTLFWAQDSSNANDTQLLNGSFATAIRTA